MRENCEKHWKGQLWFLQFFSILTDLSTTAHQALLGTSWNISICSCAGIQTQLPPFLWCNPCFEGVRNEKSWVGFEFRGQDFGKVPTSNHHKLWDQEAIPKKESSAQNHTFHSWRVQWVSVARLFVDPKKLKRWISGAGVAGMTSCNSINWLDNVTKHGHIMVAK